MNKIFSIFCNIFIYLFKKIFRRELERQTLRQFIKHYFVGFIGSLLNYVVFNLLKFIQVETKLANVTTYVVVILTTFILQKYFTYKAKSYVLRQFLLFILSAFVYISIETALLVFLIDYLAVSPLISKLVSIALLSPLSFLFQKFIVFKNNTKQAVVSKGNKT